MIYYFLEIQISAVLDKIKSITTILLMSDAWGCTWRTIYRDSTLRHAPGM